MKNVLVKRPKPKFQRNDPKQVELFRRLQGYSDEQIKQLEDAIREYLSEGCITPALAELMPISNTPVALAA